MENSIRSCAGTCVSSSSKMHKTDSLLLHTLILDLQYEIHINVCIYIWVYI